jgi:ATP-dependent Clp protease adaptor protein ClpS
MPTATAIETKTEQKTRQIKMWCVQLLNDDYTPFDFVIEVLCQLYGKNLDQARQIALDIHEKGSGLAGGPYTKEVAIQKAKDTVAIARSHEHPLMAVAREVE